LNRHQYFEFSRPFLIIYSVYKVIDYLHMMIRNFNEDWHAMTEHKDE
jgi:hypothetical protein